VNLSLDFLLFFADLGFNGIVDVAAVAMLLLGGFVTLAFLIFVLRVFDVKGGVVKVVRRVKCRAKLFVVLVGVGNHDK